MESERSLRRLRSKITPAAAVLVALAGSVAAGTDLNEPSHGRQGRLVPVKVKLPTAQFNGTPEDIRAGRVKPVQTKAGPPFLAPAGTTNVALGKPVSSSDPEPVVGELAMITDGDKEAGEGSFVELGPLLQHVTIDLQAAHVIYGIRLWHYHQQPRVYFDVIIQVSNDPNFASGVQTIFNNDMDNSSDLGQGLDMHYVDTHFGEVFDAQAVRGRYVRLYSRGNSTDDLNHYIEVEVYGQPVPDRVPLNIQYPNPTFGEWGRWIDVPYCQPPLSRAPAPLMAPEGTKNVALGKPVSSSHPRFIIGTLNMITDGDKEGREGSYVELDHGRLPHITIDLQEVCEIHGIAIWHWYMVPRVYFDVIVQISTSGAFSSAGIVYSSDLDNTGGFGFGQDKRYVETRYGKVIPVDGRRGRYVRLYSNGNSMNEFNHYVEVEVYGVPVVDAADATTDRGERHDRGK